MLSNAQKYAIATKLATSGANLDRIRQGCPDAALAEAAAQFAQSIIPLFRGRFDGYLPAPVVARCQ